MKVDGDLSPSLRLAVCVTLCSVDVNGGCGCVIRGIPLLFELVNLAEAHTVRREMHACI